MKKFKVGDTAYLVESSLYIRKGTIKNCYGNMYLFKYADGAGIKVGAHRLFYDEEAAKESEAWCYPAWMDNGGQHLNILGLPEFCFILAEAQLRCNEDATKAFKDGIAASVDEMAEGAGEDLAMSGEDYAEAFVVDAPTLEDVFKQKYIALCYDGQAETYTDIRRCKAMGTEYITLTNPKNIQGGKNRWPYLLPPGQSSVVSNPSLKELFGDGSYLYEKNCWLFTK